MGSGHKGGLTLSSCFQPTGVVSMPSIHTSGGHWHRGAQGAQQTWFKHLNLGQRPKSRQKNQKLLMGEKALAGEMPDFKWQPVVQVLQDTDPRGALLDGDAPCSHPLGNVPI